jgi:FAD/FMN-containing dehydrogenase
MPTKKKYLWLTLSFLGLTGCSLIFSQPSYLLMNAWLRDRRDISPTEAGHANDASRLNQTRVAEIWKVPAEQGRAEARLQELLRLAHERKLGVSIAGAKHSMGGHSICPDGIVIDMLPFNHLHVDEGRKVLRAGAGARWSEIVPHLDARGLSVAVMQSNNDFSVGGSLSVNCHGWQCRRAPIAETVVSFRLLKADSTIVTCSRTENAELFSLALGGYGLFGVILEAELKVVPNERYCAEPVILDSSDYAARFERSVNETAGMAYGRLCIVPGEQFLKESILTVFRKSPCEPQQMPKLREARETGIRREVFRAQIGSVPGKKMRWKAEKSFGEIARSSFVSRNQLLNEPAALYQEQNADRTDILQEYFVPALNLEQFLVCARRIIPKHEVDLLNVTVRDVCADNDTFLRYADRDMFALVMLFNQPRTEAGDKILHGFSSEMIDAVLECGGRYYLPYRLHASREQFHRAYPQAAEFFAKKRLYDPHGLFRNQFYLTYGMP